jgi:hypothetical protein
MFLWAQYFESAAARELFEFQVSIPCSCFLFVLLPLMHGLPTKDTDSEVSKKYASALKNVMQHGVCLFRLHPFQFRHSKCLFTQTKMVYVASLNDQVVPSAFVLPF